MTDVPVGVIHMPRTFLTALASLGLLMAGLVLASPAEADWSRPGNLTDYRVCRTATDGGDSWQFISKVRKYDETRDARAGINILKGRHRREHWSSGWLQKGETQISTVRVTKSRKVRVQIWHEAGDRDSSIGTALEMTILKPRKIRHC